VVCGTYASVVEDDLVDDGGDCSDRRLLPHGLADCRGRAGNSCESFVETLRAVGRAGELQVHLDVVDDTTSDGRRGAPGRTLLLEVDGRSVGRVELQPSSALVLPAPSYALEQSIEPGTHRVTVTGESTGKHWERTLSLPGLELSADGSQIDILSYVMIHAQNEGTEIDPPDTHPATTRLRLHGLREADRRSTPSSETNRTARAC
jgi:hypothetical protein